MVIKRTYCELREILQANNELVRVKQFIPAPDCGTTVGVTSSILHCSLDEVRKTLSLGSSRVEALNSFLLAAEYLAPKTPNKSIQTAKHTSGLSMHLSIL